MSENPYAAHTIGGDEPPIPEKKPGILTAFSIVAICFAVFYLFGGCCGVFAIGIQETMINALESAQAQNPPPPGTPDPLVIMRKSVDAQKPYLPISFVLMALNLIVAICLLVGAVGCLKVSSWGRGFLARTYLAAGILGIIGIAANTYIQLGILDALNEAFKDMPNMGDQTASQMVGLVIGSVFSLTTIVVFFIGWRMLSGAKVRDWYAKNS